MTRSLPTTPISVPPGEGLAPRARRRDARVRTVSAITLVIAGLAALATMASGAVGQDKAVWFLMRGSGAVALLLLTAVTALGVATRGGIRLGSLPRFATLALHRSLSLLSVVFIAVHVATAVIDPFAAVRLVDVVVPFTAASRPLLVGLGALAVDLILALVVTSVLRERIGLRAWRTIHWAAYATWPVAFVHSLGMGTDASSPWLRSLAIACVVMVGASVGWRLLQPAGSRPSPVTARR